MKDFIEENSGHLAVGLVVLTKFIGLFGPLTLKIGIGTFSVPHVEVGDFIQTAFHMGFLSLILERVGSKISPSLSSPQPQLPSQQINQ